MANICYWSFLPILLFVTATSLPIQETGGSSALAVSSSSSSTSQSSSASTTPSIETATPTIPVANVDKDAKEEAGATGNTNEIMVLYKKKLQFNFHTTSEPIAITKK